MEQQLCERYTCEGLRLALADLRAHVRKNPTAFVPPRFGVKYKLPYRLVGASKADTVKNLLKYDIYYKGENISLGELVLRLYPSNDTPSARSPRGCKRSPRKTGATHKNSSVTGGLSVTVPASGASIVRKEKETGESHDLVAGAVTIRVSNDGNSAVIETRGGQQPIDQILFDKALRLVVASNQAYIYNIKLSPAYVQNTVRAIRRFVNYQSLPGR